jgi:hypothetical protein
MVLSEGRKSSKSLFLLHVLASSTRKADWKTSFICVGLSCSSFWRAPTAAKMNSPMITSTVIRVLNPYDFFIKIFIRLIRSNYREDTRSMELDRAWKRNIYLSDPRTCLVRNNMKYFFMLRNRFFIYATQSKNPSQNMLYLHHHTKENRRQHPDCDTLTPSFSVLRWNTRDTLCREFA